MHTEINDLLLGALLRAVGRWCGQDGLVVGLEGHGRQEWVGRGLEVSRTVGWFTNLYPVLLEGSGREWGELIRGVKEGLRGVPDKGLGYGVLRYVQGEALAGEWDLVFNYLGQTDSIGLRGRGMVLASEGTGRSWSPEHRADRLTVSGRVEEGRLVVHSGVQRGTLRGGDDRGPGGGLTWGRWES